MSRYDQQAHVVELWFRYGLSWSHLEQALREVFRNRSTTSLFQEDELEEEVEELKDIFESIQRKVMHVLKTRKERLRDFNTVVSSSSSVNPRSYEKLKTVSGKNKVSFDEIFSHWNYSVVWSFLDFGLLKSLVSEYGLPDVKTKMNEYRRRLKIFQKKAKVSVLMKVWQGAGRPDEFEECKRMIHELDWPRDCTLEKLESLRMDTHENLLKKLPLSAVAFVLFKIAEGCISVTWVVRPDLVQDMKEALVECIAEGRYFKENQIGSLKLDGELFMSMEQVHIMHALISFLVMCV